MNPLAVAVVVGLGYAAIGVVFGEIAGRAASVAARDVWRYLAFAASALVFAAHIGYEHFRARRAPRDTAWHVCAAVALGGLGLALAAVVHELWTATAFRTRMLVALVAWPLLTAVPAYVVARVAAAVLAARWPRA